MKKNKELNFTSIIKGKSNKAIVALHGWQGNKDSFLPLAKNSLFKDFDWFLLEGPYMVGSDPKRRTWSYEKEPNVFEYKEPKKLMYFHIYINFYKNLLLFTYFKTFLRF